MSQITSTPDDSDGIPTEDEERDSAPRHDRYALSPEEFDQLRAHLPWPRRPYLDLLVLHGLQKGEIERLAHDDLDAQTRILRVGCDNPGDDRLITLDARTVVQLLTHRNGGHGSRLLAPWPTLPTDLRAACDQASIVRRSLADVRHSYAVWARMIVMLESVREEERANRNGLPH